MDDKAPLADTIETLRRWYHSSAAFCKFHEAIISVPKCATQALERNDEGHILTKAQLNTVLIPIAGELKEVEMLAHDEAMRTLGELTSPGLTWTKALEEIAIIAQRFSQLFKARMDADVAVYLWNKVLVAKVCYKLLFATVSQTEMDKALRPAFTAFKRCLSFQTRGTSNGLIHACGFGEIWHRLNIDRLSTLLRCLESRRETLRQAAQAMLHAELLWNPTRSGILEEPYNWERGWSKGWVGQLRQWMMKMNIKVHGCTGLQPRRHGDKLLIDLVSSDEDKAGLHGGWEPIAGSVLAFRSSHSDGATSNTVGGWLMEESVEQAHHR